MLALGCMSLGSRSETLSHDLSWLPGVCDARRCAVPGSPADLTADSARATPGGVATLQQSELGDVAVDGIA